jgi:hypothetical protein
LHSIELAPYLPLNLYINQNSGKNLSVSVAPRNILNQPYESYNRCPMPAFHVTTGLRLKI